jgi:hypothetical protein
MWTYLPYVTDNPVGNILYLTCVVMTSLTADLPTLVHELHPEDSTQYCSSATRALHYGEETLLSHFVVTSRLHVSLPHTSAPHTKRYDVNALGKRSCIVLSLSLKMQRRSIGGQWKYRTSSEIGSDLFSVSSSTHGPFAEEQASCSDKIMIFTDYIHFVRVLFTLKDISGSSLKFDNI